MVESRRDENMHDPASAFAGMGDRGDGGSVLVDEHPHGVNDGRLRARARRASEGAHVLKSDGKRSSGELRCEKCGKGYKHSSCLTKHLLVHPRYSLHPPTPSVLSRPVPMTQPPESWRWSAADMA